MVFGRTINELVSEKLPKYGFYDTSYSFQLRENSIQKFLKLEVFVYEPFALFFVFQTVSIRNNGDRWLAKIEWNFSS